MTDLRPSVANKGRGGRRPGAGAPRGNMNALRHGVYSAKVQALIAALAAHPATREALLRLARRQRARTKDAERTAALLLYQLLERCLLALKLNQTEDQAAGTDALLNAILPSQQSNAGYAAPKSISERDGRGRTTG